jgi:hypothetical protein
MEKYTFCGQFSTLMNENELKFCNKCLSRSIFFVFVRHVFTLIFVQVQEKKLDKIIQCFSINLQNWIKFFNKNSNKSNAGGGIFTLNRH